MEFLVLLPVMRKNYLYANILEFSVSIYNSPLLIIGPAFILSLIFFTLSTFPLMAEVTIKYPFTVTIYNLLDPNIYPAIVLIWFFYFKTFNTLVDIITFQSFLSKTTKKPLSVTKKILFLFIIGVFVEPASDSQLS